MFFHPFLNISTIWCLAAKPDQNCVGFRDLSEYLAEPRIEIAVGPDIIGAAIINYEKRASIDISYALIRKMLVLVKEGSLYCACSIDSFSGEQHVLSVTRRLRLIFPAI